MTIPVGSTNESWQLLPEHWRRELEGELLSGEHAVAWFRTDLDSRRFYNDGLVIVTDQRVLVRDEDVSGAKGSWQSWPLATVDGFESRERSGYGVLELKSSTPPRTTWSYTAAQSAAAKRFVLDFAAFKESLSAPAIAAAAARAAAGNGADDNDKLADVVVAPAPPPVRSLWRLTRFAKPWAGWLTMGFVLTLLGTAAGLVSPYLTKPLIDNVLLPYQAGREVDIGLIKWYMLGMFGAAILSWLLNWAKTYVLAWVSEQVSADLRNETYAHMQRMSLEFFGTKRTGDLISRVSSDTDRICSFLSINLADFGTDVVMIVMTAGMLLYQNPALAVVTLIPFPFIAWMVQYVRTRLRLGFARGTAAWAEMVNVLADTIPGIRVVKAFAQEQREIDRFKAKNQHVLDANNRVNTLWAAFTPAISLLTELGLLVIWAFGAWSVIHFGLTVGTVTMFTGLIGRLYIRLDSMSRMLAATQRAAASTNRIFDILDKKPTVAEPEHPIHPGRLDGKIELRHVSFKYGDRYVLRDLNLTIEPGEMIGLVGPSGAGKSTVVNLICRFYDVSEGAILVDGTDLRSFPVEEYRHNIGIVLQEPFLFFGTIAENIAYGKPDASHAEIVQAARAGRAHDFILKLPDGYDSLVGERGQGLSGGERQRISIARALLTDPRILILDEATSSVDTETEREIQAALDNLIHGRTTIAIAHRLSTLQRANRLVVLENGEITEIGKQAELAEGTGTYSRLHQAQLESVLGVQP